MRCSCIVDAPKKRRVVVVLDVDGRAIYLSVSLSDSAVPATSDGDGDGDGGDRGGDNDDKGDFRCS